MAKKKIIDRKSGVSAAPTEKPKDESGKNSPFKSVLAPGNKGSLPSPPKPEKSLKKSGPEKKLAASSSPSEEIPEWQKKLKERKGDTVPLEKSKEDEKKKLEGRAFSHF